MRHIAALTTLLLAGCADKEADSGFVGTPTLSITSPSDGAWLDEGAEVTLSAAGRNGAGAVANLSDLAWSTGDWAVEGNDVVVTDLPAGNHTLEAQVLIEGELVSDSVEITVFANGGR